MHDHASLVAGICSVVAIVLSTRLIFKHLYYFTNPNVQSKIVGILWMVPIYAFDSWISLRFRQAALYLDMLRDVYEGYVLYLFLALCIAYLGRGNDYEILKYCQLPPGLEHPWPFRLVCRGGVPTGENFVRFCKLGTLQYSVMKPILTMMALSLKLSNNFEEGNFGLTSGWLWTVMLNNISVVWAFYCLGVFYIGLKKALAPYDPIPKFLCIKAILFLCFWQGLAIALLTRMGLIHEMGAWSTGHVSLAVQDFLLCVEMAAIALAHNWAFPFEPFVGGAARREGFFQDHFSQGSALRDLGEVAPMVLPRALVPQQPPAAAAGGRRDGSLLSRLSQKISVGGAVEARTEKSSAETAHLAAAAAGCLEEQGLGERLLGSGDERDSDAPASPRHGDWGEGGAGGTARRLCNGCGQPTHFYPLDSSGLGLQQCQDKKWEVEFAEVGHIYEYFISVNNSSSSH